MIEREKYDFQTIFYQFQEKDAQMIYLLEGVNSDSKIKTAAATFNDIDQFKTDRSLLYNEICELRVIKTPEV